MSSLIAAYRFAAHDDQESRAVWLATNKRRNRCALYIVGSRKANLAEQAAAFGRSQPRVAQTASWASAGAAGQDVKEGQEETT